MAEVTQQKDKKSKRRIIITLLIIITIIIILLLLMRCGGFRKELKPVEEQKTEQTVEVVEKKSTGFVDVADKTVTPELKELFDKATSKDTNIKYEPLELIAKQENEDSIDYKFLAQETTDGDPSNRQKFIIIVHEDFGGDVSLTEVEAVVEPDEEGPNKKTIVVDDGKATTTYYIVVFHDQYGNELQKLVLPYGATPSFHGSLPEGFQYWDKEIGPVTGNTNYYAVCYEEHHHSHDEPTTPVDADFYTNSLYSKAYGASDEYIIDAVFTTYLDDNPDSKFKNHNIALLSMGSPAQTEQDAPAFRAGAQTERTYLRCAYEVDTSSTPKTITLYTDSSKTPSEQQNDPTKTFTIEIGDKLTLKNYPTAGNDIEFDTPTLQNFFSVNQAGGYGYIGNEMVWLLSNKLSTSLSGSSTIDTIGFIRGRAGERFTRYSNNVQELTIGPLIKVIDNNAFVGIGNLKSIDFTNASNLQLIGSGAFAECFHGATTSSLIFPDSLLTIADRAFSKCTQLTSITLNQGLTTIGQEAFCHCNGLESITIPSTVITIGDNAFNDIGTLSALNFAGTPTIKTIGSSAFQDKSQSIDLEIPASVTTLGLKCFNDFNPAKVSIPASGFPTEWRLYKYNGEGRSRMLEQIDTYNLNDSTQKADFIKGLVGANDFTHKNDLTDGCFQAILFEEN